MKSKYFKWLIAVLGICALHVVGFHFVHERGELIWILLPVDVLILAYWFRLVPKPRLTKQPRWQQVLTVFVLLSAPIAFYVGLTQLCRSPFSIKECLLAEYFFVLCLEIPLLYHFNFLEFVEQKIDAKFSRRKAVASKTFLKLAGYLVMIPVLLSIFAIHRPKLLPRPFEFASKDLTEQISFPSREAHPVTLRGEFVRHPNPHGTVLTCHGVGANRADISAIVQDVHELGFNVLAFDFRGHGESDGHTITYGFKEKYDVQGAYDYCLQRPDVDPENLYALGVSMGGSSLLLALPEMPRIKAAMIDSAFADLEGMIHHQLRLFPDWLRGTLVSIASISAWVETGIDTAQVSPVQIAHKIQCPVTLIHGKADKIVPVIHSDRLSQELSDLKIYQSPENIGHIGTSIVLPQMYRSLIQFTFTQE